MLLAVGLFLISNVLSAFAPPFWLLVLCRIMPAFLHSVFYAMAMLVPQMAHLRKCNCGLTSIIIGGIALVTSHHYPTRNIYGQFIRLACNFFFLITAWFASYTYFADYLIKVKGLNNEQVSYMLLLFGVTEVVSNFAAGRLLAKNMVGTTLFFLSGIFLLPILLQYTGNSFFSTALAVGFWGVMYGPCFLTGICIVLKSVDYFLSYPQGDKIPEKLQGNEPQFVVDYFNYYRTPRGFHKNSINSNGAWTATNALSFMNMPLLTYIKEISPRRVLLIAGSDAHSRYFSEDAYKAAAEPKELMIIPNASHVDLYDRLDDIPFDKLATFFNENLKPSRANATAKSVLAH